MKAQIGKWGKSLAERLPGDYVKELGLTEGMKLEISLLDGGLLLRPSPKKYSLKELLEGITQENLHDETEWGPSRGRESW